MEKKYPNKYFRIKQCRACDKEFTPQAPSQHYCAPSCKGQNAYYIRQYGITEAEYKKRCLSQDNRCHLCGSEGFVLNEERHSAKLCVDHCHTSGVIRKLLCHNCNRGLGLFKDDPDLMRQAATYLETFREGATTIPNGSTPKQVEAVSTQIE